MKILLLNPPADEIMIRDYYCSKTTKSNYLFHPIDLLIQSGILAQDHEVKALDAIVQRLDEKKALEKIEAFKPDAVFGLAGAVSWRTDLAFYKKIKEGIGPGIFLSGDLFLEDSEKWLREHHYIKGILLRFASRGLAQYLSGQKETEDFIFREGEGFHGGLNPKPGKDYSIPRPRHELFDHTGYHFSFARRRGFATVLTDFGCPFKCRFCVMASLGFRTRPIPEIKEELEYLSVTHCKEIFFCDQCFGAKKDRTRELLDFLSHKDFGFTVFTRPDLLLRDGLAERLKKAGCHTVILGVESASMEILKAYQKDYDLNQIREAFKLCRGIGLRTVATFIIGLPEDSRETIEATMRLARELDPDFVSYNVAVPRQSTPLRADAAEKDLLLPDAEMDQSGSSASMDTRFLTTTEVVEMKKRAVRDFYLRPSYLLRRLISVRSPYELSAQIREGLALIGKNL